MATVKIRNPKHVYRLMVDPEKVVVRDNLQGWILDLLVKAGGRMTREDMVKKFSRMLARRRPELSIRHTSVLSAHQRVLRDMGVLQIIGTDGKPIPTRKRISLVK